jgi:hypothetical protein
MFHPQLLEQPCSGAWITDIPASFPVPNASQTEVMFQRNPLSSLQARIARYAASFEHFKETLYQSVVAQLIISAMH